MTVEITVPGAAFTKYVARLGLPFLSDAMFYGLFGTDSASTLDNRTGGADATLIGTPTYSAGYASVSGTNAILGPEMTQPFTMLVATRAPSGANPHIGMIDFGAGTTGLMQFKNGANTQVFGNGNTLVSSIPSEVVGATNFSLMGFTYDGANVVQRLYNGDPAPHTVSTAYTSNVGSVAARIGGSSLVGGNPFDVAAGVFYDRALSLAEIAEVRTYLQGILADRGITLL